MRSSTVRPVLFLLAFAAPVLAGTSSHASAPSRDIATILADRIAEDPSVAQTVAEDGGVSRITELYMTSVLPPSVVKVSAAWGSGAAPRRLAVSLTDSDSEAAIVTTSATKKSVTNNQVSSLSYRDLIDNDRLLRTTRRVQAFRVASFRDWRFASRIKPFGSAVAVPEWNETELDSTLTDVSNPIWDIKSPLMKATMVDVPLPRPVETSERRRGLIGLLVTEEWSERDPQAGYRRGTINAMYPLSTARKSVYRIPTAKRLFTKYRESWKYLHTRQGPRTSKTESYSDRLTRKSPRGKR